MLFDKKLVSQEARAVKYVQPEVLKNSVTVKRRVVGTDVKMYIKQIEFLAAVGLLTNSKVAYGILEDNYRNHL